MNQFCIDISFIQTTKSSSNVIYCRRSRSKKVFNKFLDHWNQFDWFFEIICLFIIDLPVFLRKNTTPIEHLEAIQFNSIHDSFSTLILFNIYIILTTIQ